MSEAIAVPETVELSPSLTSWQAMTSERRLMLKQICGADLNDAQFALLCEVGVRTGLDPFQKQIYGLILGGKFTIITGIGGFRAVARRNGLAGIDAPKFSWANEKKTIPYACEVTVYRWAPNGQRESYTARALYSEFARNTPIWKQMPCNQLAKCTEALAHRMGFTESLGDVYERAEIEGKPATRAEQVRPSSAKELLAPEPEPEQDDAIDVDGYEDEDPTAKDAP